MEKIFERLWDLLTVVFGGFGNWFSKSLTGLFGSSNARLIKKLQGRVDSINALEPKYEKFSDEELQQETLRFRERLNNGETPDDLLVESFALVREAGKRFLGMRHYDVQMVGGMVLHSGAVAEMVTGEGKTLVATLPAYLNAISREGVHVITVNDYLARRDMEWMAPLYMGLGLTVGAIQGDMQGQEGNRRRQEAYACDITYGTNNEFGFDYLRDNMRPAARGDDKYPKSYQQAQGRLNFAVIDEVDNILIDEARTPLIISGPAHQDAHRYADADRIARALKREEHYIVNEKDHTVTLTDDGVRQAEKLAGVESFYTAGNMDWPHLIDNALKAHHLYKLDVNYVVKEGKIIIVDEFTGRLMDGRQWSDGLHQAVEAKEGVTIKEETQTLATVTLQNFFKLYKKLAGMTGTAMTEANEFWKIYKLDVVAIPTNRKMQRTHHPDVIYSTEKFKWKAVAEEIESYHKWDMIRTKKGEVHAGTIKQDDDSTVSIASSVNGEKLAFNRNEIDSVQYRGRPILVGTVSIEKSEMLSAMLERRGIKHEVLNAKNHKREAEIVAQAGQKGSVTIATNMAGRGTDIVLGGNPESLAWARLQNKYETRLDIPAAEWDQLVEEIDAEFGMAAEGEVVKQLGGLHVVGTERHESRRIDLQLRGRCGRQGDPGSSRFYLSFDDDLIRVFAGPFVRRMMELGGFKDDMPIESAMVSRRIDSAQKKREEYNFEIRKSLLEYDEVMDEQRKRIYGFRQKILDGSSCRDMVLEMITQQVDSVLSSILAPTFGAESFAKYAGNKLSVEIDPKIFRNSSFDEAAQAARDEAERRAETDVLGAIEENLPRGEEEAEWNWQAMSKFANVRWNLNFRDSELKQAGRDRVDELILERARQSIRKTDLDEARQMLDRDYGVRTALYWTRSKFGLELKVEDFADVSDTAAVKTSIREKAREKYDLKEAEYPVMAGLSIFDRSTPNQPQLDRDGLAEWASQRFETPIERDDFSSQPRDEIRNMLVAKSAESQQRGRIAVEELRQRIRDLANKGNIPLKDGNGAGADLAEWFNERTGTELPVDEVDRLEEEELKLKLESIVEDHFHPEMRRMERLVLLEVVDSAWKDHLLAMDYLRSAVGQRGIAQLDPKVEYKREGMRLFESLWEVIDERVTDLIFRMEQFSEGFVSRTFVGQRASHPEAQPSGGISEQQRRAIEMSHSDTEGEHKVEPIRNRDTRLGRNDPCHCGSGKKYKSCHMRSDMEGVT